MGMGVLCGLLRAEPLPDPAITASATAYNGNYAATNLFAPYFNYPALEYATKGLGAVTVPLTREATNGTWVEFDFGKTVSFNQFILRTRANAVDVVAEYRLIVSSDPTFDAGDTALTFDRVGHNGDGIIQSFPAVTGRYVRWEVTKAGGSSKNLGGQHVWFMRTPEGQSLLPPPTVIDAYPAFSAAYMPAFAVNGNVGSQGPAGGQEYASLGGQAATFIDFDFGASKEISGFDFWNRPGDVISAFDLVFSETSDFSVPVATKSFTSATNGLFATSAVFAPVKARYLRLQATAASGYPNTGVGEIQFYTPGLKAPEFAVQPKGGTLFAGERITLTASAVGAIPISYQWQRDGAAIPGATGTALVLTNVQVTDSGSYTVVASNSVGQKTSDTAVLTVQAVTSIADGLAGYWPFDETAGAVARDASGRGNNGTVANNFFDEGQWSAGKVGGALTFRGPGLGDDSVVIPDFPRAVNGTMSVAAWVWADVLPDRARIACGGSGADGVGQFLFTQSTGDNALRGYVTTGAGAQPSAKEATPFPIGEWQHVVMVADGAKIRVYREAAEVATVDYDGTLAMTTGALSIGVRLNADDSAPESGWWQGRIDDVAYWTRALAPNEVVALYAAGNSGKDVRQADQYKTVAPSITIPPADLTVYATETARLLVAVRGTQPMTYQWWRNGTVAVPGATNNTLTLENVQPGDAGNYTVVVANAAGSATNDVPAVVTVLDPPVALADGLVVHLPFDEMSGTTAADRSGLGNNGALLFFPEPVVNWTPGILGGALLFNSGLPIGNEAVSVPSVESLDFTTGLAFSAAVWAKAGGAQTESGALLCKGLGGGGEAYCIDIYGGGFRFFVRGTGTLLAVASSTVLPDASWQLVVAVYDAALGRMKLYVNGVEAASSAPVADLLSNGEPLDIGCRQWQGGYTLPFIGALDDVRIYNRMLTPREVKALYEMGVPAAVALTVSLSGNVVTIEWPAAASGFVLESSPAVPAQGWSAVPGVAGNKVSLTASGGSAFYRLRRP
jgi:hypothetical protein